MLGAASAEYAVVDLACVRAGAVGVPLQAGAPAARLAPIVAQTAPRLLAVDMAHLDAALRLAADAPSLGRIVVLGHHPEATVHQVMLDAARDRLAAQGRGVALSTLASVVERGRTRGLDGRHAQRADLHLGGPATRPSYGPATISAMPTQ
ncbi:AMP-binding protein [Streptomyces sp. NPDC057654]|uniref:AMP-binding protein n=1 Tax=Streptomyces sp. NPDC057654 TaxID=3346196 RepID=UPI00367FE540